MHRNLAPLCLQLARVLLHSIRLPVVQALIAPRRAFMLRRAKLAPSRAPHARLLLRRLLLPEDSEPLHSHKESHVQKSILSIERRALKGHPRIQLIDRRRQILAHVWCRATNLARKRFSFRRGAGIPGSVKQSPCECEPWRRPSTAVWPACRRHHRGQHGPAGGGPAWALFVAA